MSGAGDPVFIDCQHVDGGTTTREAVVVTVPGRALLGPTEFPVLRPMVSAGERCRYTKRLGWIIGLKRGAR